MEVAKVVDARARNAGKFEAKAEMSEVDKVN